MMQRLVTIMEAKNGIEHQNLSYKLGSIPDTRKIQYNVAVAIEPTRTDRLCNVVVSFIVGLTSLCCERSKPELRVARGPVSALPRNNTLTYKFLVNLLY
jgi:hypothetical protein